MEKHVFIAVVSYLPEIEAALMNSLLMGITDLASKAIKTTIRIRTGDADLGRARNAMAAEFLTTDCTDMLCIDADVSFERGAMSQLLAHNTDLVAGIYPQRVENGTFPVRWLPDQEKKGLWAVDPQTGEVSETGLIEVEGVPTGFLRLSRTCVSRMSMYYGDKWYFDDSCNNESKKAVSLFEFTVRPDHQRWSEDLTFCSMWREIGGRVWMDPMLNLSHHGRKVYRGCIGNWLRNREQAEAEIRESNREREIAEQEATRSAAA